MGQQTSPADRPPAATRSRRPASTVLAATSAIAVLLGATGIVLWTSQHHVSTGKQSDSVFVDTLNVFDSDPKLPATQVSTATVTDNGTQIVTITDIQFSLTPPPGSGSAGAPIVFASSGTVIPPSTSPSPPTVPFVIFPGENCKNAVLQPGQNCMVSVRYTNPGQIFHGSLIVTMADGTQSFGDAGANQSPGLDQITADPYVADFGTRLVGQTSPVQTITMGASPDGIGFDVVAASVVDTVPTPGDRNDYHITADNCTGNELQLPVVSTGAVPTATVAPGPVSSCTIQVTDTPGGVGARPAFLSVAFCSPLNTTDSVIEPAAPAAASSSSPAGSSSAAPPPPPDPNIFCPSGDHLASFHQIVALNGVGQTTPVPPTTTTTTPPPPPPPPPSFTPTLTALPPLDPADRTTAVSGTGFPVNTAVTFALVPVNSPANTDLSVVPDVTKTTTDGSGNFTGQILLIMPHTAPGPYEIMAQAQFGKVPVSASVPFLVVPGIQEPPKFVGRH